MRVQRTRVVKSLKSMTNRSERAVKDALAPLGAFGALVNTIAATARLRPDLGGIAARLGSAATASATAASAVSSALGGAAVGFGLMYYLDPLQGRRRRALAHDKLVRARHLTEQSATATRSDFVHRARGFLIEMKNSFSLSPESPSDEVIEARVRSKLGYACSHPHAVSVKSENGTVWLSGRILENELGRVMRAIGRVRGVSSVKSDLEVYERSGSVSDLQGGSFRRGQRFELLQDNWSPSARFVVGCTGLALASYGLYARPTRRPLSVLGGVALVARSITNLPLRSLVGLSEARGIEVVKTVHIKAPLDEVFRFWQEPENLPKFMEHVKSVRRLDSGNFAWEFKGPLDISVGAETTLVSSPSEHVVMWQSTENSAIGINGIIRFQDEDGGTRLHLRMTYSPVGGIVGHAFVRALRADPKHDLDEDMIRFKSLIEHGKATVHGHTVKRDEFGVSV